MADGTRPNFKSPYVLHGAMKDFASRHGLDTGEAYLLAAKLLINIEDAIEYQPNDDPLLHELLDKHNLKTGQNQ